MQRDDAARQEREVRDVRYLVLRDLDTRGLEPLGVIFEQFDRTARIHFFEDAAERDETISRLKREFESFDAAVSAWSRTALAAAYGKETRYVV